MSDKPRTVKQSGSLFGTLTEYAGKLNDAGFDYHAFLEKAHTKGFNVKWTKANIKELFDAVTMAMYNKTSSQLSTVQMQEAYLVFERHLSEQSGVSCRWHSLETQMLSSDNQWWDNSDKKKSDDESPDF